jgi:hypothetical protein
MTPCNTMLLIFLGASILLGMKNIMLYNS